jgi:hypothetical protein
VADARAGTSSSFSCGGSCPCPANYYSSSLTPSSSTGPVGGTAQFAAKEYRRDCFNLIYGPYDRSSSSTWASSNTSVATVNSQGVMSCLSVGSAGITAQFQAVIYGGPAGLCSPTYVSPSPGSSVVVKPIINVGNTMFSGSVSVSGGNHTSAGSITISASPACDYDTNCLHAGDFAVVEIIKNTAGGSFTYRISGTTTTTQTQNVPLALGDTVTASFDVTVNSGTPSGMPYSFTIRVADVRRPSGTSSTSILNQIVLNPGNGGMAGNLTVNP